MLRRLPHVRGGVSREGAEGRHPKASSPRAWGCFSCVPYLRCLSAVFPTCVGVFLRSGLILGPEKSLPHVRGGVSKKSFEKLLTKLSSPRAWGCFCLPPSGTGLSRVFPTCVGVFLFSGEVRRPEKSLPHVRGGVSLSPPAGKRSLRSSPRAWGCFCTRGVCLLYRTVFPTCVGVFLAEEVSNALHARLPHVRGGVSDDDASSLRIRLSSPRAWGCFHRPGRRYSCR